MTRITIAILALLFAGCQAQAGWPHNQFSEWRDPAPRKHVHRHHHKPRVIYRTVKQPQRMPGSINDGPQCHPSFPSAGDQAPSFSLAETAAKKAWSQQARFSFGERYADPENAKDVTFECVKSGTGALTGDWFNRCEMRGRPCRASKVEQ